MEDTLLLKSELLEKREERTDQMSARTRVEKKAKNELIRVSGRPFSIDNAKAKLWKKFSAEICQRKEGAEAPNWCKEMYALNCINSVVGWAEEHNILVLFSGREETAFYSKGLVFKHEDTDIITVNSVRRAEIQLFYILHECGHFLVEECGSARIKETASYEENKPKHLSKLIKVKIIEEELEAWWRGSKLAERLHINLDQQKFDEEKAKCIISYMKWFI